MIKDSTKYCPFLLIMSRTLKARLIVLTVLAVLFVLFFVVQWDYSTGVFIKAVVFLVFLVLFISSIITDIFFISNRNKKLNEELENFSHQEDTKFKNRGFSIHITQKNSDDYDPAVHQIKATKDNQTFTTAYTFEKKISFFLGMYKRRRYSSLRRINESNLYPETSITVETTQNFSRKITVNHPIFADDFTGNNKRDIQIGNPAFDEKYIIIGEYKNDDEKNENERIAKTFLTQELINSIEHLPLKKLTLSGKKLTVTLKDFQTLSPEIEKLIQVLLKISAATVALTKPTSTFQKNPADERTIQILKNYWLSLGDPKIFDKQYYAPEKQENFKKNLTEIQNLNGVKLNTQLEENSINIKKSSSKKDVTIYTITADVQYYFESTNNKPLEAQFESTADSQPATFKLTCKNQNGTFVLDKIENSIF